MNSILKKDGKCPDDRLKRVFECAVLFGLWSWSHLERLPEEVREREEESHGIEWNSSDKPNAVRRGESRFQFVVLDKLYLPTRFQNIETQARISVKSFHTILK